MIYFVLTIYILSVINVFITEMKMNGGLLWSFFLSITFPIWEGIGGLLYLLLYVEKLIMWIVRR